MPDQEPMAPAAPLEQRFVDAWREWLGKLATDAEAALAAAMAYKELDGAARDTWLSALEQDAQRVDVPAIAVYAPLLAVESDKARRARISEALGSSEYDATPRSHLSALTGRTASGLHVATINTPLYLDFVHVLACGYRVGEGFEWVRHDPIVAQGQAPQAGTEIGGAVLERAPLKPLVDELAHAVLAHVRSGRQIPDALRVFADLFGASDTPSSIPPAR